MYAPPVSITKITIFRASGIVDQLIAISQAIPMAIRIAPIVATIAPNETWSPCSSINLLG